MADNDFLSQDEVDALLKGVGGQTEEPAAETTENSQDWRPYNLATQERIVRGRMPALETINERFMRSLRIGLDNFIHQPTAVSAGPIKITKYIDFTRNLSLPINLNLVLAKPLRGTALFALSPNLIFLVIDYMFGGSNKIQTRIEGRDFSLTEQSIIQRLLKIIFDEYAKSWKPVYELKLEYVRYETSPQFVNVATPNEVVVSTTFNIEVGDVKGELQICMPYSMLEPIRELLSSNTLKEEMEADKRWLKLLSEEIQAVEVELAVNFASASVTFEQIMNMKTGDFVPIHLHNTVLAEIDGVPLMECKYGVSKGQYAIKVEKILSEKR